MTDELFGTRKTEWGQSCYSYGPPAEATPTSIAAAKSIKPVTGKLQHIVMGAIEFSGADGVTDENLCVGLDMNPSTLRPRRRELVLAGLVKRKTDSLGNPVTRKTRSGRKAQVWVSA